MTQNETKMTQNEAKKLLKELSAKKGGSIVGKVTKAALNPSSRVLIVGLGGMGCKTVNAVKGVYLRKFTQSPDIKFLAVDTAIEDMGDLRIENGGHLTAEECFPIYDSSASQLLIKRPPIVESWLSPDIPSEIIGPDGAKSRRAIGRVMLCGTNKYIALRNTISNILSTFTDGTIEVVVCAGISGGTGSGTFIDVSYMLRNLLTNLNQTFKRDTRFYGVFYTPDVQKSIPAIGSNSSVWDTLKKNGYAALKELNYFMNIGHPGSNSKVYSLSLPSGETVTSDQPIFNRAHVFIISPTAKMNKCEDIIESTGESIMNVFKTGSVGTTDNGTPKSQSMISTLCNFTANIGTWENNHVGHPANNLQEDKSGIKNTSFPAFMNNHFSSIGFRSIYFPRNEMVAYCANTAFKAIIDEYEKAFELTQGDINYLADCCQIGSIDQIFNNVKSQLGIDERKFRIVKGEQYYPILKGFETLGHVIGLDDTVTEAKNKVDRYINSLTGLDVCIRSIVNNIKGLVEGKIPFNSNGTPLNFWNMFGPYGGIVLLRGNSGKFNGFIQMLTDMADNIATVYTTKQTELNKAIATLETAKETIARDRNPHWDEIEVFIDACQNYSNAYFECSFISQYMSQFLIYTAKELNDYNNQTFDIYVPIIKELAEILNEDSEAFANTCLQSNGNSSTFSLNAFNISNALQRNDLFKKMFDNYIADQAMIDGIKNNLASLLFDADQRENWTNYIKQPDLLSDELRKIFKSVTAPLISSMLEKFIVLVYANKATLVGLNNGSDIFDANSIESIWNNDDLRNSALRTAAQNIVDEIKDSVSISFDIPDTEVNKFSNAVNIILLNETPNLNSHIIAVLNADPKLSTAYEIQYIGNANTCEYVTEITMFESLYPFALDMVKNMHDYAESYFFSETGVSTAAGRHLDEITEQWQKYLPEIYGVDTEKYFVSFWNNPTMAIDDSKRAFFNGAIKNNDKTLYEEIRAAVEYGIDNGYIEKTAVNNGTTTVSHYRMLILKDKSPEFVARLTDTMHRNKSIGKDSSWKTALATIKAEDNYPYFDYINLDRAINNNPLISRQTVEPDNKFDLKNVYRVVRADMEMIKLVLKTKEEFEEINFFHNINNASEFDTQVKYFILAKKCGMISYDPSKGWILTYSSNPHDKPIIFFDDYRKKLEKLDMPLMDYLVFSAFVKNGLNDTVKQCIDDTYDELEHLAAKAVDGAKVVIPSCRDIFDNMNKALETEIFAIRDENVKFAKIELQYNASKYKDYYGFPKKYEGAATIIDNIKSFIDSLEALDETGDL
ncbi:MAG: tubulin-like doman-containing protein [Faecalibacterium sp.]|nr:tubulin-like doman-containing protein [Ruminococcus sp.]MCM1391350.1 tubulin-like doman-containing protein [Ruminococcus sp.]MCM1484909.1 tubulin-like doman-containing protein [Faecalibacterium sp.]